MTLTLGTNVSNWEARMNWIQGAYSGLCFAFIKFTDGVSEVDQSRNYHWAEACHAKVLRSPYHFFRNQEPIDQARRFFESVVYTGNLGELPPMLDVELYRLNWANVKLCVEEIEGLFGRKPIIYTSRNFWPKSRGWEHGYDLFQASWSYNREIISIPGFQTWVFRQFTDRGHGFVYGVPKECKQIDLDVFDGSFSDLRLRYGIQNP